MQPRVRKLHVRTDVDLWQGCIFGEVGAVGVEIFEFYRAAQQPGFAGGPRVNAGGGDAGERHEHRLQFAHLWNPPGGLAAVS
jgi:hypothetical protein